MSIVSIVGQLLIVVIMGYVCIEIFLQIRHRILEARRKGELQDIESLFGKLWRWIKSKKNNNNSGGL